MYSCLQPDPAAMSRAYLLLYNGGQVLGWSFLLYQMVSHLAGGGGLGGLYGATSLTLQVSFCSTQSH